MQELYDDYRRLCIDQHVRSLNVNEYLPLCHSLASCGLVGIGSVTRMGIRPARPSNEELEQPVWLCMAESDLKAATKELTFFRQILAE